MKYKKMMSAVVTVALAASMAVPAFAYPATPDNYGWLMYGEYDGTWKSAAYIQEPNMPQPSAWAEESVYAAIANYIYYVRDYDATTDTMNNKMYDWTAPMTRENFAETLYMVVSASTGRVDIDCAEMAQKYPDFQDKMYQFYAKGEYSTFNTFDDMTEYFALMDSEYQKYAANGGNLSLDEFQLHIWPGHEANHRFDGYYTINFSDTTNQWVTKLANLGIMNGTGNNMFSPNATVTREQAATMIVNVLNWMGVPVEKTTDFAYADDTNISDWAKDAVYTVSNILDDNGTAVMAGTGNGNFSPKAQLTNEQATVMAVRLYYSLLEYFGDTYPMG